MLSAVWTRRALRDEFFVSAKSSAAAIDHDATDHDANDANDARRMDDDAGPRDPPPVRVRTLAGPATDLRSGRVAVVAGGAEAEVEEM